MCGVCDRGYGTQSKGVGYQDVDELIDYSFLIGSGEMVGEVRYGTGDERDR